MDEALIRSPHGSDVEAMARLCAAIGTIAIHDRYLFWLFATTFSRRSLVATVDGELGGYLLSAPVSGRSAEFIVQVAVAPNLQRHRVALDLLEEHRRILLRDGIAFVQTSITVGCRPGEALMRRAIDAGFDYQAIPWPPDGENAMDALGVAEVLYEASVPVSQA